MLDTAVEAEVLLGVPGLVVVISGFLTSRCYPSLEATEMMGWEETTAVVAGFVTDVDDVPFFEHGEREAVRAGEEAGYCWDLNDLWLKFRSGWAFNKKLYWRFSRGELR